MDIDKEIKKRVSFMNENHYANIFKKSLPIVLFVLLIQGFFMLMNVIAPMMGFGMLSFGLFLIDFLVAIVFTVDEICKLVNTSREIDVLKRKKRRMVKRENMISKKKREVNSVSNVVVRSRGSDNSICNDLGYKSDSYSSNGCVKVRKRKRDNI